MVRILIPRRVAVTFAWLLSVTVACTLGWLAASLDPRDAPRVRTRATDATVARTTPQPSPGFDVDEDVRDVELDGWESEGLRRLPEQPFSSDRRDNAPETSESEPAPRPRNQEDPTAPSSSLPDPRPDEHATSPAPPEPEPVVEQPSVVIGGAALRARRADRLAEGGETEGARLEAETLLAEYESFSGLTAALVEDGIDEVRARLSTTRVLQLAGHESIATELARELKRSYRGTAEVLESIRRWHLLAPRITRLESSIEDGEQVLVTGTLENPDIGEIRRVFVQVEALDAAGNVVTTTRTRVRPKTLAPGIHGSFNVRFKNVDPASILRTRASVVEWESEVVEPG